MVEVVIPTVKGREASCERVVAAFKEQDAKVLIVKGASTCGEGWAVGLSKATAAYVLLGADDALPHKGVMETGVDAMRHFGTVEAGVRAAEKGIYPSPRVVLPNGEVESCGSLGGGNHLGECPDGTLANMASFPIATKEMWAAIGPPPPIHYYVDDLLGYRARCVGLRCEVVRDYAFTHLNETFGRQRVVNRAMEDRARFLQACA